MLRPAQGLKSLLRTPLNAVLNLSRPLLPSPALNECMTTWYVACACARACALGLPQVAALQTEAVLDVLTDEVSE